MPATVIDHRSCIKRVMLHVDRQMEGLCRLEELAEIVCFPPFHLNRVFKTAIGETPHQYVFRKRMEPAGFQFLDRRLRTIDIALDVGYETPSAFCKGFKTYAGLSPRRFRDTVSKSWFIRTNRPFHPATDRVNEGGRD